MRNFYRNWIEIDWEEPDPGAEPCEKLLAAGAAVAAVGACGIDSDVWWLSGTLIVAGTGLAALGFWRWKHVEVGQKK